MILISKSYSQTFRGVLNVAVRVFTKHLDFVRKCITTAKDRQKNVLFDKTRNVSQHLHTVHASLRWRVQELQ